MVIEIKHIKQTLQSIVILSIILMLAVACTPAIPATDNSSLSTDATVQPAAESGSGGVTELVYWHTQPGVAGQVQDELVAKFNASQNRIKVTSEFQGNFYGDLAANILTAYGAGGAPDVSQLGTYEVLEFTRSGILVELSPYLNGKNPIDTSDWPKTLLSAGVMNWPEGKEGTYWLPFNIAPPVLFYNQEAFKEAGISEPPKTWDEFYEDARKLTIKDKNGTVQRAGVAFWNISWPMLSAIWSEGGDLTNKDYSHITLNDPVVIDVLTKFQELVKEGAAVLPDTASGGHRGAFKNGLAAITLDSPAIYGDVFGKTVGFTPGVAIFPAGKAGRIFAPAAGGLVMLASTPAEKRDAAWEFMKFMLSAQSIATYAEKTGYAAFYGAAQTAAAEALKDERYVIVQEGLKYVRADFTIYQSPAVRDSFEEAWQKIFFNLADVKTTLDQANAKAEIEIKKESH